MVKKYKVLDLFSGLGGFSLGLERTGHFETVAFCDNNKYSKLILDKHWKGVKVYDDVREISKEKFKEDGIEFPDIITGGFPCQPFSVAGKQKGTSDDRHLWPEMFRIIKAFKPRYVIGENVRGIINIQDGVVFETVCTDLESEGYEVQPFIIPAAGVGAPHRRERVWIIANREESMVDSDNIRFQQHSTTKEESSGRGTSATSESTSSTIKNMENSDSRGRGWQERFRTHDLRRSESKEQNNNFDKTSEGRSQGGVESSRSNVVNTISNDEGREISRSDEEKRRIQEEHRTEHSTTGKSSRTSEVRNGDNGYENVADTENRRGQPSQPERWEGIERGSIDRGGIEREGQNFSRTEGNKNNVADTNDEGLRTCIGGSDNDHATESRSGGVDRTRSESDVERHNSTSTEIKGMDVADTNESRSGERKVSRDIGDEGRRAGETRGESIQPKDRQTRTDNIGSSNSNVADTKSIRTREPREFNQTQGNEGGSSTQLDGSSKNDADTNDKRLEGFREGSSEFGQINSTSESSDRGQTKVAQGWWSVEPNVGRVAHGIPGRVHRLKGLGNSIVPQIVEEIGKALIKAERG